MKIKVKIKGKKKWTNREVALLLNEYFWFLRQNPLTKEGKLSGNGVNAWWHMKKKEHNKRKDKHNYHI